MTGALIIFAVTVVTGVILRLLHRPESVVDEPLAETATVESADGECCGLHEICEKKGRMMQAPEYFDDEELDRFAGRAADGYSPGEMDEFREVLYTLLPSDVEPWGFSLQARGIELPAPLRDEWVMLAAESKQKK